jgi:hypothetical protein
MKRISDKKIQANRQNAKKSTGPKSIAGKKRSSLNSIKHGLTCEKNVCIGENKKEFEELKQRALKTFPVFDFLSEIYVGKIIHYEWLSGGITPLKQVVFQGKVLIIIKEKIFQLKNITLKVQNYLTMIKKYLFDQLSFQVLLL